MPKNGLRTIATRTTLMAALILCSFSGQAGTPLMVNIPRLTLDTALKIARTALEHCRQEGYEVTVTVLDRGGQVQAVLRDTLAPDLALEVSREKAYTALSFNHATSSLGRLSHSPLARLPHILMLAGGLPIHAGGALVGAIGVSGTPSGKLDASCARAGITRVQTDLDMNGG